MKKNGLNSSNAWVFISHSNKDFDKIRQIRNKLEALHYKPLLFFLKCLEDEEEISDLIKREIMVRDRFILCDSKNARESVWVQKEKDFILSLNRPYEVIDLDGTEEEIEERISRFDMRSSIYVWSTNSELGRIVSNNLIQKSFKTGILPDNYFRDYYYYSFGSSELVGTDFVYPETDAYYIILIDRVLTQEEIQFIEAISPKIHSGKRFNILRVFAVSENETKLKEIAQENKELLFPLYQDGIYARYLTCGDYTQVAELIIQDIIELDMYHFHLRRGLPPTNT